jgi:hypothetical protein
MRHGRLALLKWRLEIARADRSFFRDKREKAKPNRIGESTEYSRELLCLSGAERALDE